MKHVKLFEQFVSEVLNETLNERFKGKDLKEKESVVTESVKKGQIYTKASSDDQRLNARRGRVTAKEGDSVKLTKQKDSKTFNAVLTYNSGSWKGDTEQILIDIKELEGWELRESVVFESKEEDEAHDILQDLLNEWDPMDLEMMDMDQAMDTVDSYGHKGSKAKKIAQYLVKMAQSGQFENAKYK